MQASEEVQLVLKAVKRALKEKRVSYQDLADELKLSLSGVKKMLSSEDVSYKRLSQICRVLSISVSDLLVEQERPTFEDAQFTPAQQEYFVKNMETFHVFWKLAFERLSVEDVQKRLRLTDMEMFKQLKKLDELDLIELHSGNKVRLPKLRPIRHFGDGPLIRKLYRDWSTSFMHEVAHPHPPKGARFLFRYLKMRPETYNELISALDEVEREFVKRAIREMTFYSEGLIDMRWMIALSKGSFVKEP